MRIVNNAVLLLLCCVLFCGCSSIETYSYRVSQTVARTAIQENKNPKELQFRALVILCCSGDGTKTAKIRNNNNMDYGEAVIDKDSFAAFLVDPGYYNVNWKPFYITGNKCYFIHVTDTDANLISTSSFEKYHADKFLVKNCNVYGEVRSAENCFVDKVSGWEVFGHNTWVTTKYTLIGIGYTALAAGIILLIMMEAKASAPKTEIHFDNGIWDQYGRPVRVVPAY